MRKGLRTQHRHKTAKHAAQPLSNHEDLQHARPSLMDPETLWKVLRHTVSKWNDDPVLRFGAAMAFYTAIAIIPLVFLVIEVTTLLMGHQRAEAHLLGELEKQMGARGAQALVGLIDNWRASASTGMATVVALVTLLTARQGAPLINSRTP